MIRKRPSIYARVSLILYNLIIIILLFSGVSLYNRYKIVGVEIEKQVASDTLLCPTFLQLSKQYEPLKQIGDYQWKGKDHHIIYGSMPYQEGIVGFSGEVPLYLVVRRSKLQKVVLGDHIETDSYIEYIKQEGYMQQWENIDLQDLAKVSQIDGISGATLSSVAISKTILATIRGVLAHQQEELGNTSTPIFPYIAYTLLLISIVASMKKTRKWQRMVVQGLNIIVLGFWGGKFLSLAKFSIWSSQGISLSVDSYLLTVLAIAILLPLLTGKDFYCSWVCPYGAMQELLYRIPLPKIKLSQQMHNIINRIRDLLFASIIFFIWSGVCSTIIDYEPFSAFIWKSSSVALILFAICWLFISLFFMRPYCQMVCPTGVTLQLLQFKRK